MSRFPAAMAVVALSLATALAPPVIASQAAAPRSAPAARSRASSAPSDPARSAAPTAPSEAEARFVSLINQERARRGLRQLEWDPTLAHASRLHSEEMARLDYFDHRSPVAGRETPADRWELTVSRVPDEYLIAENLFFGTAADVAWGHRSLMESDGHRQNILEPQYVSVGVGIHVDRGGQMWVTQMFTTAVVNRRVATGYSAY